MTKHYITHKRHDDDKVVTHVQVADTVYEINPIISQIENQTEEFYTRYGDKTADVSVRTHPTSGKKYLWSQPDGCPSNNLDNLPDC
jgi:hypothetical protein